MRRFSLSATAKRELDKIWLYVAQESGSTDVATRLIATITDKLWILSQYPHAGRRCDDLRPGLRSFVVAEFIIIYRLEGL